MPRTRPKSTTPVARAPPSPSPIPDQPITAGEKIGALVLLCLIAIPIIIVVLIAVVLCARRLRKLRKTIPANAAFKDSEGDRDRRMAEQVRRTRLKLQNGVGRSAKDEETHQGLMA
ncbi:hypothetical protein H072_3919 [Dactylellina haptotyla CBS 200.50]|uniref:Uncharacterized protein n=1 Tax=Dactylellina haptotyla (strain CBS 200.50) TaxID=1284197 RepID=S8AG68_DACHA|nr:hypothetical protein H072_3919 [Dactylellina haptotyla CBS 200.50]